MTIERIQVWHCDAACEATAEPGSEGWFGAVHVHGCPTHAELVEAHQPHLDYDTRGRGSRQTTTVSLACSCRWVPRIRWTQGGLQLLIDEYLAHIREVSAPTPTPKESRHG